jgi:uncharacterized membrane protein
LDPSRTELQELRELLRELTARVYRIEQALKLEPRAVVEPAAVPAATQEPAPPPPHVSPKPPVPPYPLVPPPRTAASTAESDLESRIASHWFNRVGIAAVLIGVSYFLKFAFDNEWIGPAGRVSIGLLAGIAVVVWSQRFRSRGYRIFSYSLKAVGIGVLYLSLWGAFQVFHLIPAGVAFLAMLVVTAATAAMALSQDAEILAAFAMTGGFSTPLLLSTGQNRELQLFTYVAILDLSALVLVIFKPWRRLLLLSYAGTLLLYIGWYSEYYNRSELRLTLGFATLFFAIYGIAPLVARDPVNQNDLFVAVPLFLAFVNAGVYFLQVYVMLEEVNKTSTAWFALALAAVYIFLSRQVRARSASPRASQTLHFLHLALAGGFITIAIPIRLDAHWITIGWFVEAAVLLWVAARLRSDFLNAFAIGALSLGVVRLLVIDNFYITTLIFNARMATFAVAIAVLGLTAWYGAARTDEAGRTVVAAAVVLLNILALVALSRETSDYYSRQMSLKGTQRTVTNWADYRHAQIARDFTYSALWMSYGGMLMIVGFWRRSAFVRWQALVLIAVTTVKVFVYDVGQLDRVYRILSFIVLGVLLLAISFVYQRDLLKLSTGRRSEERPVDA